MDNQIITADSLLADFAQELQAQDRVIDMDGMVRLWERCHNCVRGHCVSHSSPDRYTKWLDGHVSGHQKDILRLYADPKNCKLTRISRGRYFFKNHDGVTVWEWLLLPYGIVPEND